MVRGKAKKKSKKTKFDQILEQNERIEHKLDRLRKDFKRAQVVNFIRFIIVAIPVLLAVLYLIPLFREFLEIYRPLVDFINNARSLYQ